MNIFPYLAKVIEWLHDIDKKLAETRRLQEENLLLAAATSFELARVRTELQSLALAAGDLRVALPLIREIYTAVVPEPVATIKLLVNDKETTSMDFLQGQKSTLTLAFFGASGNPTVPKGVPEWAVTDATNFSLEVAPDSLSAVQTAIGPEGSSNQVTVTVDGVTSDPLAISIIATPPPPPEPVAKVVINASTPA